MGVHKQPSESSSIAGEKLITRSCNSKCKIKGAKFQARLPEDSKARSKCVEMKSRNVGKFGLIALLVGIFCLYFLAFYFDLGIQNFPVFKTIMMAKGYGGTIRNTTKTILFWNRMFSDETFYFGKGDVFRHCPVNDCFATPDRSLLNVVDFDALLFHGNELNLWDLPAERESDQYYVYVNLESPQSRPFVHYFYDNYFNLTMTYRLDSDVPWAYGIVRDVESGEIVGPLKNTTWSRMLNDTGGQESSIAESSSLLRAITSKRKPVAWFVSNCPAKSGRLEYVKELSRHIAVDVYGKCGSYSCPHARDCLREIVEPEYFFYLSFENSLCQDYVTEKLYNPLRYNVVPVVYGGANYTLFAPPYSYVNVLDFDTPKDLAAHLRKLMNNRREYEKYFRWKKYYRVETHTSNTVCKLCEFLHARNGTKTYENLSEWYARDKCPLHDLLQDQKYATRMTLKDRS